MLTGQVGKIPTPLLAEGAVAVPCEGVQSLKDFLEHGRPLLQRGARRSTRSETYVVQFREPYASLGHANPLSGHNQLRHITAENECADTDQSHAITVAIVTNRARQCELASVGANGGVSAKRDRSARLLVPAMLTTAPLPVVPVPLTTVIGEPTPIPPLRSSSDPVAMVTAAVLPNTLLTPIDTMPG